MSDEKEQLQRMEKELNLMREKLLEISEKKAPDSQELDLLMKYVSEQKDRTERMLASIGNVMERVKRMEQKLTSAYEVEKVESEKFTGKELAVSPLEADILNFIKSQEHEMTCADDIKTYMNYKGRNAACTRLGKLMKEGLLTRLQIGRKVYYKLDAGKATNTLIISPPQ